MTLKAQRLVVHVHEQRRLFHVSMYNADREQRTMTWQVAAAKARYAYEHTLNPGRPRQREDALIAGLIMAMVNTDYTGWDSHFEPDEQPNTTRANERKLQLVQAWTERGYTNVGVRNATSKGDPVRGSGGGISWNKRFNPSNMTLKKVYDKIDWINASLQLDIPQRVRTAASRAIIGENATVDNMATLLRFIRQEMGLDQPQSA